MTVLEIMKKDVATCGPLDDLATAGKIMAGRHCGFVPVVDSHGALAGVITDRDACLYASERGRSMAHIAVKDAMSRPVFSCLVDENVKVTIATMAKHHVHRLPVINRQGHLMGVVSIDDVIQAPYRRGAPSADEILEALKGISAARPLVEV